MWVVYNDEPTNGKTTFDLGHSKGIVVADNSTGFWLVHSVPKFPQLPYQNNNSYSYPRTGIKFGQSFLCISMTTGELDKIGSYVLIKIVCSKKIKSTYRVRRSLLSN